MSDVAISVSLLALVAVLGLWLGSVEFKGVGLGIGGVLFGGILSATLSINRAQSWTCTHCILCRSLG